MAFTQSLNGRQQLRSKLMQRAARNPARSTFQRSRTIVYAGLFDFLTPKTAPQSQKATELVEQLVSITERTNAGLKISPADKEQTEELVNELQQFCIKNPVKSKLLWGEYEVLYATNPNTIGGPFRTAGGQAIFAGQSLRQILEEPDVFINQITYKTLGFLSGYSRQYGVIQPVSGDTFLVNINRQEAFAGIGSPRETTVDIKRRFQVLYLDETIRVVRFIPDETLEDSERSGPSEPSTLVFRRVKQAAAQEETQDAPQEEEEQAAPAPKAGPFGGTAVLFARKKPESLATQAERQVKDSEAQEARQRRSGTASLSRPKQPETRVVSRQSKPETAKQPSRAELAKQAKAEAASAATAAKEKEAREKEAREARERAEAEKAAAKARAEAERAAKKEKADAIKAQLAELMAELQAAQAESRQAAKEQKEAEREGGPVLKQVAGARTKIATAEAAAAAAAEELRAAQAKRKEAEDGFKQAQANVREAEKELKKKLASFRG